MKSNAMMNEMFSNLTDENGNPISKEKFEKMNRESLVLLLNEYIEKMTYLHEDDKLALSYIANSLRYSFKESDQ